MLSAMMMITDLLAAFLALRLASLFRFYNFTAGWKGELSSAPLDHPQSWIFFVLRGGASDGPSPLWAVCSGHQPEASP